MLYSYTSTRRPVCQFQARLELPELEVNHLTELQPHVAS